MAFRKALSLQKYKLVLVLTIEMAGTIPPPNKFISIEVCRTDLSGYNEGYSRTPLESRKCIFKIPSEPCLTARERGGPAHTLFPLSRTHKLECVLLQMPTIGIGRSLQNCEVFMGVPPFKGKQQTIYYNLNQQQVDLVY